MSTLANRLRSMLKTGVVNFTFEKKDGTHRSASGTLNETLFEYSFKGGKSASPDMITYWDTEKNAWRSFHEYQLISIES